MFARKNELLLLLLLGWALCAQAQPYNFLRYSVAEGLPQSQVWCACSDNRGYMWFGTQGGGVCRYDGEVFVNYTTDDGLPSNFIQCIYQDDNYRLWVGTNRGMCYFDGRKFQALGGSTALINTILQQTGDGSLWAGTNRGIYSVSKDGRQLQKKRMHASLDDNPVYALHADGAGGTWIGTEQGIWHSGKQLRKINEGLPSQPCFAITTAPNGNTMAVIWGVGVGVLDGRTHAVKKVLRNPGLDHPLCLYAAPDDKIWVGTQDNGVVIINPETGETTHVSESNGLPHNHVRAMVTDRSGQLWIATSGGGVARRLRQNFRHFTKEDGLTGNRIYAVHEDKSGRIWVAVSQNGIQMFDSTGFHRTAFDTIFPNTKCKSICTDSNGALWVGTEGKGIAVIDTSGVKMLNSREGLLTDWVQKIIADDRDNIWIAAGGITRVRRNADGNFGFRKYGYKEGLPDLYISTLALDADGRVWYGTQTGRIGCIVNDKAEWVYGQDNGLPPVPIRCISFDLQGRLWAGTKGNGLWVCDANAPDDLFRQPETPRRLSSQNIYLLQCDNGGRIWAGSENGVDKLVLNADGKVLELRHYGKSEGFLGIETCQDAAICDSKGRLWFGTMNGLTQYTPGDDGGANSAPLLHFEQISLFYKPLESTAYAAWHNKDGSIKPGLELPYRQNHLSFSFRAVELEHPERLRYRWKLDGAEQEWSPASVQESVNYANLPPGKYTFQVQASSEEGVWSAPVSASFAILEPFWQKTWFLLSALAALIALFTLAALMYVRRIRKQEAERRAQLEIQNHVLQLEQKALQLQMNPHFIFNALTSIQSLITEKDFGTARQQIHDFARLMRSILYNSRRQNISLKEEVDTLEQYLRIEQFCHQQQFDFSLALPEAIDAEEVELPPMLLQPFVENAVVHGVSHLNYRGHIDIRFRLQDDILECTISDNGIGREQASRLREEKKPGHQSVAMQVTEERLEALRGNRPFQSLAISDVLNEKGEIAGTRVVVQLPVVLEY